MLKQVMFTHFTMHDSKTLSPSIAVDVSPRNITGLVDHLEEDGLVERVPDPDDRRSVRARVTSAGQKRLDEIRSEMHQASDTIVGNFTDEELIQLRHLCLKLVQNMYAKEAR